MAEAATEVLVVVRGMEVLVEHVDGGMRLCPREAALRSGGTPILVGRDGEQTWYAAAARVDADLAEGLAFTPVRALFAELPEATLHLVGRALAWVEFEETHRHCGRCASATEPAGPSAVASPAHPPERTRVCPRCKLTFHPRIPPAVIVLVEDGDRLLLARGRNFPPGRFSAVAGFVEIGESLEEAARREVREEVGVEIAELRYHSSQPWPFGHSLMIGFHARYASGELRPDGTEIVEADWFRRDALPLLPPPISIARRMIDAFLTREPGGDRPGAGPAAHRS
jgi:NAD+ diphosphatase